jgi:hypothetical protein
VRRRKEEGGRADIREHVRVSEGVHGRAVIPLLAKNEPAVGLEVREREHAEAEAGAALTGVRGAEPAGADQSRNSILPIRNALRKNIEDKQR